MHVCYDDRDIHFDGVALRLTCFILYIWFGIHCRNLRSLNVWRAKGLTDVGLGAIADKCHELEELDAGWW